jgi:hypothetical protein
LNQLDLLIKPKPEVDEVPLEMIRRRPTLLRAFQLAQDASGLEDKEIYGALDIDASHWTRIKNGTASLALNDFVPFMHVVRNEIPLIWIAEKSGYDWSTIRKHRSDLERENERLRQELAERDRAIGLIISHHQSRQT